MRMRLFTCLLFFSTFIVQAQYPQDYFRSPMDIPLVLSGTFGELRSNHFHTGIDIKTEGIEGKKIYAAADGYVSRIKVSPWGYGNAIYVTHPNGFTTVYGHLKSFRSDIQAYIKKKQYEKQSFEVDLYLSPETFKLGKGDVFCYSGNSGGSGGPHLHFEIRKTSNSKPINPLLFGFKVPDHQAPTISGIYFYRFNEDAPQDEPLVRKNLNVDRINNSTYELGHLKSYGLVSFGIHTFDRLDGASNKNGPVSVSFFIDDELQHEFKAEKIAFSENRYLNAHIDYDLKQNGGPRIHRNFVLPGNALSMYPVRNQSVFQVDSGRTYQLKWVVSDAAGNKSTLNGKITGIGGKQNGNPSLSMLYFDQDNHYTSDDIKVDLKKGYLYQNVAFEGRLGASSYNGIGPTYLIGKAGVPLHKHGKFSIRVQDADGLNKDKLVAVRLDKQNRANSVGGAYQNGWIQFKSRNFGKFAVMIDTLPPVITPLNKAKSFTKGQKISFKATDDLSGIQKYKAEIDGKWVLLQYDPKKAKFYYVCDELLKPGAHDFVITIEDERKNLSSFTLSFEYR